jgi:hypothetical protein
MNMKNNALIPMENRESVTLYGLVKSSLKTLLENPHAAFFVETIPLCVQLNLIILLRLTVVIAFCIETWEVAAILLDLLVTTLIYSISVMAKLRFLLPSRFLKMAFVTALAGGLFAHMVLVLLAPNIQTSIVDEFLATALPMLLHYLAIGAFTALIQMLREKPDSFLHRYGG